MSFVSTRGGPHKRYTFEHCLFSGLAEDGGMFLPAELPTFSRDALVAMASASYVDVCVTVLGKFLHSELSDDDIRGAAERAFKSFSHSDVVPVVPVKGAGVAVVELWWGPTLAFKDLGLQLIGQLLQLFLARRGGRATILVGTSGDTGSAAIHGVLGLSAVDIVVLYPKGRTSKSQELQMTTVAADNVHVLAADGTSDDLDVPIKAVFHDQEFCRSHHVMSANSINVARILIQMVHFFYAYGRVATDVAGGSPVAFVVPTGAAGHVTAGVLAAKCGLPVSRIVAATNQNDIVHQLLSKGSMTMADAVVPTTSPSMDIQVPYNVERLMYLLTDGQAEQVAAWMTTFETSGVLRLPPQFGSAWESKLRLTSACVLEPEVKACIAAWWRRHGYLLCPHSAVAAAASQLLAAARGDVPVVVAASAHAAKFEETTRAVLGWSADEFEAAALRGPAAAATAVIAELPAMPPHDTPLPKADGDGATTGWQPRWTDAVRRVIATVSLKRGSVDSGGSGSGSGSGDKK